MISPCRTAKSVAPKGCPKCRKLLQRPSTDSHIRPTGDRNTHPPCPFANQDQNILNRPEKCRKPNPSPNHLRTFPQLIASNQKRPTPQPTHRQPPGHGCPAPAHHPPGRRRPAPARPRPPARPPHVQPPGRPCAATRPPHVQPPGRPCAATRPPHVQPPGQRRATSQTRRPPGGPGVAPRANTASHRRGDRRPPSMGRRRVATGANHPASHSSAFRRGPGTPVTVLRRGTRAPI